MNNILKVIIAALTVFASQLFFISSLHSQTDVHNDPEVGARISAGIDKKIVKGLHLSLDEEFRFDNNFRSFDRMQTTLALGYKITRNVKVGVGYSFIAPFSSSSNSFKNLRHRAYADVTGTFRLGRWNLSLKERFQWTYKAGEFNEYQNPRNLLMLKSRIMLKYKGLSKIEPYTFFEVRNVMNAPVIYANYDGSSYLTDAGTESGDPGWFLHSFKGGYVNRLRGAVGVDLKINKKNHLDIYFLGDYLKDKVVDANSEGTVLKSYNIERGFFGTVGAEYVFSF